MNDAKVRAEVVRQLREADDELEAAVRRRAKARGLEIEGDKPNGGRFRLIDFDKNDLPVYEETQNVEAAITTAANMVRSNSTYNSVNGSSVTIGLWESGGIPRVTHQEFGGRVTIIDGSTSTSNHASHVTGTLVSQGINPATLGMAPGASVAAFSSTGATAEMTANGASQPNTNKLYLSNHSYGSSQGWNQISAGNWTFSGQFSNDGDQTNDYDPDFGRYASRSAEWDGIAYNLPYYQIFVAAGNQRTDAPANGDSWSYGWGADYIYDSTQHPLGNNAYKASYDNMEGGALAKNVIAVGSSDEGIDVNGNRDPSQATAVNYSSRGPTDDGRIKPDIHANGTGLISSISSSDTATASYSGTSMSSPNACGSAALLIDYYTSRFPAQAMRASTLKALILHTADDRGVTGPDYKYGWGIMNTQAAADVIKQHADNNGGSCMIESVVNNTTTPSRTHTFAWNGTSALRVTLCWTDPPGTEKSGHDSREKALVNDLNLTVTGPGATIYRPYVMPYAGDWTNAKFETKATTGVNDVDNVEQVYLASPSTGTYVITVNYTGALTNNLQNYSLIVTGQTAAEIVVEDNGPPLVSLVDNSGIIDYGAAAPSQAPLTRTFTIRNTGGSPLNGLAVTKNGPHASDYTLGLLSASSLETGQSATFSVDFDPLGGGTRLAAVHVASNDSNENAFDIIVTATGLTEIEAWRYEHFDTYDGIGDAADDYDADKDGLVNLLEFGLATSPDSSNPPPLTFEVSGAQALLTYQRNKNAMTDHTIDVIWTDELETGEWSSDDVSESILSDNGVEQQVEASVPMNEEPHRFLRVRMREK